MGNLRITSLVWATSLACPIAILCGCARQDDTIRREPGDIPFTNRWDPWQYTQNQLYGASDKELLADVRSEDRRLALAAQWERVCRSIRHDPQVPSRVCADTKLLREFVDLVGQDSGVQPPGWWEKLALESSGVYYRGDIDFPRFDEAMLIDASKAAAKAGNCTLADQQDNWKLTAGGRTWTLPRTGLPARFMNATAAITDTAVYAAIYFVTSMSFKLYALDPTQDRIKWTADVVGQSGVAISLGGTDTHAAEVCVGDKKVVVFGVSCMNLYVEAFDKETGANLWRFASIYSSFAKDRNPRR